MANKVPTLMENVTKNIVALRKKKNLSQAEFAKAVGFSTSYISMLEGGKREISLSAVETIARKLKIPALTILIANPKL